MKVYQKSSALVPGIVLGNSTTELHSHNMLFTTDQYFKIAPHGAITDLYDNTVYRQRFKGEEALPLILCPAEIDKYFIEVDHPGQKEISNIVYTVSDYDDGPVSEHETLEEAIHECERLKADRSEHNMYDVVVQYEYKWSTK